MKLSEAALLLSAIRQCQAQVGAPPVKFSYMLAKNATALEAEVKTAQEAVNQGVDMAMLTAYERARMALLRERAKKDDKGDPVVIDGMFQFETPSVLDEVVAQLNEQFPDAQGALAVRAARTQEINDNVVEIKLFKLGIDHWPDIPALLVEGLLPLVADD
jgi:hypothetical protein